MNTFDAAGNLLGDDETDPVGSPTNPLQLPDMVVTASPPSMFAQWLEPPYVYILVAAIGLASYFLDEKHR